MDIAHACALLSSKARTHVLARNNNEVPVCWHFFKFTSLRNCTTMSIFKPRQPQPPNPAQRTPVPGWAQLIIIASLVAPPIVVAIVSPDTVFFYLRLWGIEYQFQKGEGNITPPRAR
jgi:hypothetical protein